MNSVALTHRECVRLLRSPERGRYGTVTIDDLAPIPLLCLMLDDGDLLIPTGDDRSLIRAAAGRPVSVEFAHRDRDNKQCWTVRGIGLARPMSALDRPRPLPRSTVLATPGAFRNGIRVVIAHLTGSQTATDAAIPQPRNAGIA
ncbi:hypothetical protein [Amycolatopsis alkalitolerans]|uniref:Pyridoxamine 5'-phosphate oxidase family protein n=1 Tax=Amycolatopsis alkalitolerans TaxID=2547244 RepID=A0A5C4M6G4_9PSEU|nr:hypothetical protein [Amycolatopsis alkalitolerans]TNC28030.1 hypothetical protein FG385_06240 [Amycolatopsis alkalitolerans]